VVSRGCKEHKAKVSLEEKGQVTKALHLDSTVALGGVDVALRLPCTSHRSVLILILSLLLCPCPLLSSAQVAPRGVYVCGNTTTTTGLTVTLVKDGMI
jgi:hypothetical protein